MAWADYLQSVSYFSEAELDKRGVVIHSGEAQSGTLHTFHGLLCHDMTPYDQLFTEINQCVSSQGGNLAPGMAICFQVTTFSSVVTHEKNELPRGHSICIFLNR